MTEPIIIDNWQCSIGPYESRIAMNLNDDNEMVSYIDGNLICYKGIIIPSKVLDWLLKPRYYFVWEEGGDWRESWGENKWQEHNPYIK